MSAIRTLLVLVALAGPAVAQTDVAPQDVLPEAPSISPQQMLEALQMQAQQINDELMEIQEATFEARPDLVERRDALFGMVDAAMATTGFDGPAARASIDSMAIVYDDSSTTDAERMDLGFKIQSEQTAYRQAQGTAMADEAIQAASTSLNEDMMAAMAESEPRTQELIEAMRETQMRYQMVMQQMMAEQQQSIVPDAGGQR